MKDKIVVVGSLNYDIILQVSRLPEKGETFPAKGVTFSAGGKGANQAVQAAKLGVKTYMVGCVGNDPQGDVLFETARKYGLDTTYLRRVDGPSGMSCVHAVEDGSVYATIVRGANFAITKQDIDAAKPVMREAAIVILQMEIPMEINAYAIEAAKECGCKVLLNAAPAEKVPEEFLRQCDIIVVNEVEAAFYLGEEMSDRALAERGSARLAEQYQADIIMTLGKLGSVVCDGGKVAFVPSKKVHAIETTGAGDSFIGGTAYALIQGMSLTQACEFATCCSAITVCRMGAQDSMPTIEELKNAQF